MKSLINIFRFCSITFSLLISGGFIVLAFISFLKTKNILFSLLCIGLSLMFILLIKAINYTFAGKADFSLIKK